MTVNECETQGREVIPDPEVYKEHVLIDFTALTSSEAKKIGKTLARYADARGWQYRPPQ